MLRGQPPAGALRPAKDDRDPELAAGHVPNLRGAVENLVHREKREIESHHFDHRPQTDHRGSGTQSGKPQLGDGGVHHPGAPEALEQALRYLEGALVFADFFPDEEDVGVAFHLFGERLIERLAIHDFRH